MIGPTFRLQSICRTRNRALPRATLSYGLRIHNQHGACRSQRNDRSAQFARSRVWQCRWFRYRLGPRRLNTGCFVYVAIGTSAIAVGVSAAANLAGHARSKTVKLAMSITAGVTGTAGGAHLGKIMDDRAGSHRGCRPRRSQDDPCWLPAACEAGSKLQSSIKSGRCW